MNYKLPLPKIANKVARKYEQVLQNQAPVRTGELRRQVSVDWRIVDTPDGEQVIFSVNLGRAPYGVFTNQGTGKYYDRNPDRKKWNPKPGEGTDGIKPRYWMNLPESIKKMAQKEFSTSKEIRMEIAKWVRAELKL